MLDDCLNAAPVENYIEINKLTELKIPTILQ